MKSLTHALCALSLGALLVAGCGGSKADQAVEDMEALAEEACACKDMECAKKISEKIDKLGEKYKDVDEKGVSEETKKKLMAAGMKAAGCIMKLSQGGAAIPSPAPTEAAKPAAPEGEAAAPEGEAAAPEGEAAAEGEAAPAGE